MSLSSRTRSRNSAAFSNSISSAALCISSVYSAMSRLISFGDEQLVAPSAAMGRAMRVGVVEHLRQVEDVAS